MIQHCPYCDTLTAAIKTANYCSHRVQNVENIKTNAYYFSQKSIQSGDHLSRFSIRAIYNGYQHYQVGQREHILNSEKFLVVNEGQKFSHTIEQDQNAEGIIIAFNPNFVKYYLYELNHTIGQMLDNPFGTTDASPYFYENSFEKSKRLDQHLKNLIKQIKVGSNDPIFYQQYFKDILDELVGIERNLKNEIKNIRALKSGTREELYRRMSTARDFIDAHLEAKLSLDEVAKVACLSPFHFLRCFSSFYGKTPYQYILAARLKKARFLIQQSDKDLASIQRVTGFQHKRTFQKAFKKAYGKTPYALINS